MTVCRTATALVDGTLANGALPGGAPADGGLVDRTFANGALPGGASPEARRKSEKLGGGGMLQL